MNRVKRSVRNFFTMDLSASSRDDSKKTRKKKRKKYKKIAGIEKEDFTPQQEHGNDDGEKEEEKGEATMVFGDPNCLMSPQKNRSSKRMANAPANSRRKVQWNDENGKKLVHVREFVPRLNTQFQFSEKENKPWCTFLCYLEYVSMRASHQHLILYKPPWTVITRYITCINTRRPDYD
ncbi:uncharacterized protein LOC116266036 isoform X2 [Nymphaea colorata]|uniref:uncharacterized protein LOC116266036 isoform X2 n=1 Tax=Nymphaea colorata TaxID=210225 RepID=UPI00214EC5C3|nr:uncharacterized protein LOC116266036 isoform X2 [Nymphaea colorata]